MGDSKVSPHIAVITNVYQDHIDWHGSLNEYINAKKQIFLHQTKEDILVLNIDDEVSESFIGQAKGRVKTYSLKNKQANYYMNEDLEVFEDTNLLLKLKEPLLKGKHNHYNMLTAIATCRTYDIPPESIKSIVENFEGLECRQEFIKEIDGVKFYNDTCATSVEAINAMFERFGEEYKNRIIMISGGVDKGLDYNLILNNMRKYLKALILFEGSASEEINKIVGGYVDTYKYFPNIESAVDKAKEISNDGDMIILCPGASSFNMFVNEFDRGQKFVDYVKSF
jgi:UDP-N-acetylmuramoylalanine--D-glutamate ligase